MRNIYEDHELEDGSLFGGGGMSPAAIYLMDVYNECDEMLAQGTVKKRELGKFAEDILRLIRAK